MKRMITVGVDLGASGGKMAIGSFNGKSLDLSNFKSFSNIPIALNESLYWNVFGLYENMVDGMTEYAKAYKNQISSVAIDTWGATYGLLDQRGRLLEPVYHYRDRRTQNTMELMYREISQKELFFLTGCQCNRTYTLPQLYSYRETNTATLAMAHRLLFLPDLLNYFLTGIMATEKTIAGTSSLLEVKQNTWCGDLLQTFDFSSEMFLEPKNPGTILGKMLPQVEKRIGAYETLVIQTVSHDSAAAVAAIPNFGPEKLYISIGTNVSMGVELGESLVTEEAYRGGFKNTGGMENKKILYRDFSAFWIVNELLRGWNEEGKQYTFEDLIAFGMRAKRTGSIIDIEAPLFNQAGGDMKDNILSYLKRTNQILPSTDGELFLCVLESMTLKIKYYAEYLKAKLHIPFKEVYVINGGSRNQLLMQMISNALGCQIKAGLPYATLVGNILTQYVALGELSSLAQMRELSSQSFSLVAYDPNPENFWNDALERLCEME